MAHSYNENRAPKSFGEALKKIIFNAAFAAILGIIVYISVLFIYRSVGNPNIIGYRAFTVVYDDDGNQIDEKSEIYYFKDGEEHKLPKTDKTHYYNQIYTNDLFPEVLSQILMAVVFVLMIYTISWEFGAHQSNTALQENGIRDKFEGLKLGLSSCALPALGMALLIIAKIGTDFPLVFSFFSLVNFPFLPTVNAFVTSAHGTVGLTGFFNAGAENFSWIGVPVMIIPMILRIAVVWFGYETGYRQISIKEKVVYKD